ncbi:MAG: thioredoxin family protein [Chloroflexota bacterium]
MWVIGTLISIVVALPIVIILGINLHFWRTFNKEEKFATERADYQDDPLLANVEAGKPTLLYFTADWCGSCKTMQTPAIERLQAQQPNLQVLTIDVNEQPADAERWGVLSLPRTFVLSADKHLVATNIDTASTETLVDQLARATQNTSDALQVNRPTFSLNLPSFKRIDPQESATA